MKSNTFSFSYNNNSSSKPTQYGPPLRRHSIVHHHISTGTKSQFNPTPDHLPPSRWYTVLALPFPDQRVGRRDISTFGHAGIYPSRAGYFSNPI